MCGVSKGLGCRDDDKAMFLCWGQHLVFGHWRNWGGMCICDGRTTSKFRRRDPALARRSSIASRWLAQRIDVQSRYSFLAVSSFQVKNGAAKPKYSVISGLGCIRELHVGIIYFKTPVHDMRIS